MTAQGAIPGTLEAPHPAAQRQRAASDPRASTWLAANAGSGKTRVLTDRVARLLLARVDPATILCLTYTKAAAAEMQERLFRRLGRWALLPERELLADLHAIGLDDGLDPAALPPARRLFAQALETPGGLRIQTIHAFCASLLRRFPLEAGVSPSFKELDALAARRLRAEAAEALALGEDAPLVQALAAQASGAAWEDLLAEIVARRDELPRPEEALRAALGLAPGDCEAALLSRLDTPEARATLRDLQAACARGATKGEAEAAAALHAHLDGALTPAALDVLEGLFLYRSDDRRGTVTDAAREGAPLSAKARKADPGLCARVAGLAEAVAEARDARVALLALDRARALHAFAARFLPRYEALKLQRGLLDFDDLIARARRLLSDPAVSAWVLWRLDGGIDHILVDEAQDTSPAQWAVIERLAEEMTAGHGARADRPRTLFVVGDPKQSIFSFQGADAEGFARMRDRFAGRLGDGADGLRPQALLHSFRSSATVLRAVDATFEGALSEGLGVEAPQHIAFRQGMPGRVDLWRPIPPLPKEDRAPRPWTDPVDRADPESPALQLAHRVARAARTMVEREWLPEADGEGWRRRRVTPGDILILVQRRSALFEEVIRALKEEGLPVAGADRMRLKAELAVRDVEAVLRVLALPEDSLSLAAALRSPLFGWSERDLFRLAHPRPEGAPLWEALRRGPPCEALAVLEDLRARADFLRPYDLIGRLLLRHDGRRRLLARLGEEAEEGIDALLGQALAYESEGIPSLTGFLEWRGEGDVEVKRQLDAHGDRVRVMTVHGAKGLEAPVVILPDCAQPGPRRRPALLRAGPALLWPPPKDDRCRLLREAALADDEADARERRRLLYVAMTRAQSWLVVCAAGKCGEGPTESWHGAVRAGLDRAGAVPCDFPLCEEGPGLRLQDPAWDVLPDGAAPPRALAPRPEDAQAPLLAAALPEVPPPGERAATLSPSDLGGAKALPGEGEGDEEALRQEARARGTLLHLALEHLTSWPVGEDAGLVQLLEAAPEAALAGDVAALVAEARALAADPALVPLLGWGALAEVSLTAEVAGLGRLHGCVDRLMILPDRVLAVDVKTNRLVPQSPEAVPEGLLRQMGAYGAMLRAVYPGRRVDTAILWTAARRLMELPEALVAGAVARAVAERAAEAPTARSG